MIVHRGGCIVEEPPPFTLVYIYVPGGQNSDTFAQRFVSSYQQFPPGCEHDTIVACNGGQAPESLRQLFAAIPGTHFYPRSNDGWDIGAYLELAKTISTPAMFCCGESVHFHRAGWMDRVAEAWNEHGPGMYGFFSSNLIRPHLQTTCFVAATKLLASYPHAVHDRAQRYEFEHGGRQPLWRHARLLGMETLLVTWDGVYRPMQWRSAPNILWRGDQSNCLLWCNHTDGYAIAPTHVRNSWGRWADRPLTQSDLQMLARVA